MMKIYQRILLYLMLDLMNSKMDQFILDSGKTGTDMEEGNNIGMMEVFMKGTGETVRDL